MSAWWYDFVSYFLYFHCRCAQTRIGVDIVMTIAIATCLDAAVVRSFVLCLNTIISKPLHVNVVYLLENVKFAHCY